MFYENQYRIKSSRDMDPFSQWIEIPITAFRLSKLETSYLCCSGSGSVGGAEGAGNTASLEKETRHISYYINLKIFTPITILFCISKIIKILIWCIFLDYKKTNTHIQNVIFTDKHFFKASYEDFLIFNQILISLTIITKI